MPSYGKDLLLKFPPDGAKADLTKLVVIQFHCAIFIHVHEDGMRWNYYGDLNLNELVLHWMEDEDSSSEMGMVGCCCC